MPTRSKAEGSKVRQGRKRSSDVHATQDRKISDIFPARRNRGGTQALAKQVLLTLQCNVGQWRKIYLLPVSVLIRGNAQLALSLSGKAEQTS